MAENGLKFLFRRWRDNNLHLRLGNWTELLRQVISEDENICRVLIVLHMDSTCGFLILMLLDVMSEVAKDPLSTWCKLLYQLIS